MIPEKMAAVQLMGHGGTDQLVYREDVAVPRAGHGEVLVKVTATAKNNTDRKVREGLYPTEKADDVASFQIGGAPTLDFQESRAPTSWGVSSPSAPAWTRPGSLYQQLRVIAQKELIAAGSGASLGNSSWHRGANHG